MWPLHTCEHLPEQGAQLTLVHFDLCVEDLCNLHSIHLDIPIRHRVEAAILKLLFQLQLSANRRPYHDRHLSFDSSTVMLFLNLFHNGTYTASIVRLMHFGQLKCHENLLLF